jgi:hypothetical protein
MPIHRAPADHTVHTKVREMGRLRRQTDRHAHRRSCSGHSGAPPTTDPLSAHLGPPWQPKVQHIHLDQLRRQLLAAEDLCSDLAAGAVIAIPRQLHCPSDGGEGGLPALRAASQPRASHPFEELTQLKIFLATQYTQKYVTWAGFRHRTDRHAHRRSCSGHSGAPPATDPLSARLGPPRPQVTQHIHLDQLQRQLCAVEDLCSDHAASAAIAMPRKLPCPLDGGEDGPLAMRAASQPTALCPFEASPLPPLCVASCEDVALARTPSKGRDDFARPGAVAGQEGRRACPRAPEGRAQGRRAAAGWGEWLPWAARSRA